MVETKPSSTESRALTVLERRLLDAFLSHEFEGVEALRPQADVVLAYSGCSCGCGTIGFEHQGGLRPSRVEAKSRSIAPLDPIVVDGEDNEIGGLILFLRDGLLSQLEVYSFGSDPLPLPEIDFVHFIPGE